MLIETCLLVISVANMICGYDLPLQGSCHLAQSHRVLCVDFIDNVPAYASHYNPGDCEAKPINCYHDPETGESTAEFLGDGTPSATAYGWAAACPLGMYGYWLEFDLGVGRWQCRDHGGSVELVYRRTYTGKYDQLE